MTGTFGPRATVVSSRLQDVDVIDGDVVEEGLLAAARRGDEAAFEQLVKRHRGELAAHCYRMLGSVQDAEDALQESLLAAWRGLGGFQARSSLRTWLFRVTTNACLRAASRRPARMLSFEYGPARSNVDDLGEPVTGPVWLEPWPDDLAIDLDPAAVWCCWGSGPRKPRMLWATRRCFQTAPVISASIAEGPGHVHLGGAADPRRARHSARAGVTGVGDGRPPRRRRQHRRGADASPEPAHAPRRAPGRVARAATRPPVRLPDSGVAREAARGAGPLLRQGPDRRRAAPAATAGRRCARR